MNSNNQTGLHLAAQAGLLPAVRILLDAGAPVNHKDGLEKTSLDLAADSGNHSCRKLLLLWGAAPAKLKTPPRSSSLPNLATDITEDQSEATSEEEGEVVIKESEDKANVTKERLEMDQELCQRVKEMQRELSELRKDVTRLRRERSATTVVETTGNGDEKGVKNVESHPKNASTEIDFVFKTAEDKSVLAELNDTVPPQTQESATQCSFVANASNTQQPGASVGVNHHHQHKRSGLLVETEDLNLPQLPGVDSCLVQIPPLALPPCSNQPSSTPSTRHRSTQCSLVIINNEELGASISSRDQHQHFVGADISSRSRKGQTGTEVEEDVQVDTMPSHQRRLSGASRLGYDQDWDGGEGEEVDERFQYSSDEEVHM